MGGWQSPRDTERDRYCSPRPRRVQITPNGIVVVEPGLPKLFNEESQSDLQLKAEEVRATRLEARIEQMLSETREVLDRAQSYEPVATDSAESAPTA